MRRVKATAFLLLSNLLLLGSAEPPVSAELSRLSRTELVRRDLSIANREALQIRVDFDHGANATRHQHPGEEIVYVLDGNLEYRLDGQPTKLLHAGEALFIPAGVPHAVRNVGNVKASELATYIVEKHQPLITPVQEALPGDAL